MKTEGALNLIILILGSSLAKAKPQIAKHDGLNPYSVDFSDRDPLKLSGIFKVDDKITSSDANPLKGLKPTGIFKLEKDITPNSFTSSGGNPLKGLKPTGIFKLESDISPGSFSSSGDNPLKGLKPTGIFKLEKDISPDSFTSSSGNPLKGLKPTGIFKLEKNISPPSGDNPLKGLKPTGIFKLEKDILPNSFDLKPTPGGSLLAAASSIGNCSDYSDQGLECVPYHRCDENGEIILDGAGQIGIRSGTVEIDVEGSRCPGFIDVCCRHPDFLLPIKQAKNPSEEEPIKVQDVISVTNEAQPPPVYRLVKLML